MNFPPPVASPLLASGFVFLPTLVVLVALVGTAVALKRAGFRFWAYLLVALPLALATVGSLGLAATGQLAQFQLRPPPFLPVTAACIALWVGIAASRVGKALTALPLAALVGFHAFRLPLELMMHAAAGAGVMPPQMSFSGWNFDIVTGATAVLVAGLVISGRSPRTLLIAWNALGSLLLLVIVAIAIASSPPWLAFGAEPARVNTWVAYAPFIWLPTVLVPAAAAGHVVLWRRLFARGAPRSP